MSDGEEDARLVDGATSPAEAFATTEGTELDTANAVADQNAVVGGEARLQRPLVTSGRAFASGGIIPPSPVATSMTEGIEFDVEEAEDVAARRDDVVREVTTHAGSIARELAVLQGGDYGQRDFETRRGEWTLKYEGGAIQYLRFSSKSGGETYVVSTKQQPEPEALSEAMRDYAAFVEAYNEYVESLAGVLDDVDADFPDAASTKSVVAERDRVLDAVRDACDEISGQLHRYEGGDYGTFSARVSSTRWELKWEGDVASYLRIGGRNGVYLLSQYEAPSAPDVREHAADFPAFVEAYNDHVEELEADLSKVSLGAD